MTKSPYDNLPTGKEESADSVQYQEVQPEIQEASAQYEERQEEHQEHPPARPAANSDGLHYVDVEIEKPEPLKPPAKPVMPPQASPQVKVQPPSPPTTSTKTSPLDKPPRYSSITVKNLRNAEDYSLPFEESLLVPDTMPDMEKLLFAEGNVRITQPQKQSYSKDDFLAGDITLYTVYQPASQGRSSVDVVKSVIPFKTDKCWNDADGVRFKAAVSIKDISAEMVNERKFIVKGQLLIKATEILQQDVKIFEGLEDADFIEAKRSICVTNLDFELQESTEISQDINIKESQPSPLKILKESVRIIENHRQITSGKLVINASIHSQTLYLGEDNGENKLCCLTNKTDFTQFAPVKDGIDPNLLSITFIWDDLKISIENQNMFLLKGTVTSLISGYKTKELAMVSDAYHKTRDLIFDTKTLELSCVRDTVSGEISAREVISLPETDEKPETLLCGSGQLADISTRWERGRIIIEGSVPVKLLALNENGSPFIIEASLPLRGSLETGADGRDLTICPSAVLKDLWFDEINSRQLEINVSIAINVWICGKETYLTPENLCFAETETPQQRISMAVYVTGNGDTLWDVAKRYKGDVDTIADLNGLDQPDPQKPLAVGMKLFICG